MLTVFGTELRIRRRIEIEVSTERLLLTGVEPSLEGMCMQCGRRTQMLTTDEAARFARTNSAEIDRLVETELVHCRRTTAGAVLICMTSLWRGEWTRCASRMKGTIPRLLEPRRGDSRNQVLDNDAGLPGASPRKFRAGVHFHYTNGSTLICL